MFQSKLAMAVVVAAMVVTGLASATGVASAASGSDATCVLPFGSIDYDEVFYGGETFVVSVLGSGNTDLDLYIYDESGNLIGFDTAAGDYASVTVLPYYTQVMTIRVVNNGAAYNCYTIAVN